MSVLEYDSASSLTKVLVRGSGYGGGIGSVIYTEDGAGANRRFFLYNALGSTSALTDDAMAVSSTSCFDGWGAEVATTGATGNDRKFCTKERAASIGLDYFGFRYYDYDLGRFSTRDPAGYPDGLNNYLYCSNDPVNKIDPLGLEQAWYQGWGGTARELGKMAWSGTKETASVIGGGTAALVTGKASVSGFAKSVGSTAKGHYDASVQKATDRMVTQMEGGASLTKAFINTTALTVHDVTGLSDIGEAAYGVDTRDAHKLSGTEKAQRYLTGSGKVILAGVAVKNAFGKVKPATQIDKVKEGIYEFKESSGKRYVGQSKDIPKRLKQHSALDKLPDGAKVKTTKVTGGKTAREIAEYKRIRKITGNKAPRLSSKVSNKVDPIGAKRREMLGLKD